MEIKITNQVLEAKIGSTKKRIDFLERSRTKYFFQRQINLIALLIVTIFTIGFLLSFIIQLPWSNSANQIINFSGILLLIFILIIIYLFRKQNILAHDLREIDSVINEGYEAVEFAEKSLIVKNQTT